MDRVLYINKVTDTRIREMVNVTGDSTKYDEAKISRSINDIVSQNNYTISSGSNVTCYTSFQLDENITVSTTGLPNCGSFLGNDTKDWRLYQNKNGNIIITAAEGCKLKSITITYNYANGGNLQHNKYVVPSKTIVAAKGNQISLDVGSTNTTMNGQVKVTAITVDYYKPHQEEHDYSKDYLTFEALESGTFTLNIPSSVNSNYMTSISYSTDNGKTWTTTNVDNTVQTITTPTINSGDKVLWKGVGKQLSVSSSGINYSSNFSSTGNFNACGNIMSLLYGDDFSEQTIFSSDSSYNFCYIFNDNTKILSAENLNLPAIILTNSCYYGMFNNCSSLTTAPELPATTMWSFCYSDMFNGCTALTTAPVLPAATLANYCYYQMFYNCSSLITAPELHAATLATSCYYSMFSGCTSLTVAPELPATTLAETCYSYMFKNCTSLTTAPELPATTLTKGCYIRMFNNCTSLIDAPELLATNPQGGSRIGDISYYEMFCSCTSLVNAPSILPATTLTGSCYNSMFKGCTSLEKAPELPATTLVNGCYNEMFYGCSSLNYIQALFTTTPSNTYTKDWVNGVAATGTFVKNAEATWNVSGVNGIPTGWTIETANN